MGGSNVVCRECGMNVLWGRKRNCELCGKTCHYCGEEQLAPEALKAGICQSCLEAMQARQRLYRAKHYQRTKRARSAAAALARRERGVSPYGTQASSERPETAWEAEQARLVREDQRLREEAAEVRAARAWEIAKAIDKGEAVDISDRG